MRVYKLLFMLLIGLNSLSLADIPKEFNIYNAYEKAKKTNRPVYYLVASARCSHCTAHIKHTIKPNFEQINKDFVFAMSDVSQGDKVPNNLPFDGTTPTTYIISPDGKLMANPIKGNFDSRYLFELLGQLYSTFGAK